MARLYERLAADNPDMIIHVLDNGSPHSRSRFVTHQNQANSFVGGGIKDCIRLAEEHNCSYLFFSVNDLQIVRPIRILEFERILESRPEVVQISASLTVDSDKIQRYPYMLSRPLLRRLRPVPHADLLACMLRLSFIRDFGGFPDSQSGWGYDREIGYQARLRQKLVMVSDAAVVRHTEPDAFTPTAVAQRRVKSAEFKRSYAARYAEQPDWHRFEKHWGLADRGISFLLSQLRTLRWGPGWDEEPEG